MCRGLPNQLINSQQPTISVAYSCSIAIYMSISTGYIRHEDNAVGGLSAHVDSSRLGNEFCITALLDLMLLQYTIFLSLHVIPAQNVEKSYVEKCTSGGVSGEKISYLLTPQPGLLIPSMYACGSITTHPYCWTKVAELLLPWLASC